MSDEIMDKIRRELAGFVARAEALATSAPTEIDGVEVVATSELDALIQPWGVRLRLRRQAGPLHPYFVASLEHRAVIGLLTVLADAERLPGAVVDALGGMVAIIEKEEGAA